MGGENRSYRDCPPSTHRRHPVSYIALIEAVEYATLEWADWFDHHRLHELIGYVPPAEAEVRYYAEAGVQALAA
ncbi:transposase InsO family protein [Methylobacterium sp. 1030]